MAPFYNQEKNLALQKSYTIMGCRNSKWAE
jgi:hypothetical protein